MLLPGEGLAGFGHSQEQLTLLPQQAVLTGHPETFCFFLGELMNVFIECFNERLLWSESSEPFLEPQGAGRTHSLPLELFCSPPAQALHSQGASSPTGAAPGPAVGTAQRCQGCASPSLGTASPGSLSMGRNSRRALGIPSQGCPLLSASISRVGAAWVGFFFYFLV